MQVCPTVEFKTPSPHPKPAIAGIKTALPESCYTQSEILNIFKIDDRRTRLTSPFRTASRIDQAQARRLSLVAEAIGAYEAYSLGLVDEVSNGGSETLDRTIGKLHDIPCSDQAIRQRLLLKADVLEYDDALGSDWGIRASNRSGALA